MARNMRDANGRAFASFSGRVKSLPFENYGRWIRTDDNDKEWLKSVRWLGRFAFDSRSHLIQCSLSGCMYYISVGFEVSQFKDDGLLRSESLNSGLLTALLAEHDVVRPDVTEHELVELALVPKSDEYDGQDGADLLPLCKPINIFRASPEGSFAVGCERVCLERAALFFAASAVDLRGLPYSSTFVDRCKVLATDLQCKIPWAVVAYALIAVRWDHAYLDLYRCMERLFPLPRIRSLKQAVGLAKPGLDLSGDLERLLGWRQVEEQGMIALFMAKSDVCETFFDRYKNYWSEAPEVFDVERFAKHFYKIRNSIVHYRPALEMPDFNDDKWMIVLDGFIDLIGEMYSEFVDDI